MTYATNRFRVIPLALAFATLVACDGSSKVGQVGQNATNLTLTSVEIGRLVDVYAYQRIDETIGDRRRRVNRRPELIARNIAINPNIESQSLFDASGNAVATANYEFRRFNNDVGHEELVILWDNRPGPEAQNFQDAFINAQKGLTELPASFRGQDTQARPIPIVPRNAAFRLNFLGNVDETQEFFVNNPSAIQLLEFKGDPNTVNPVDAFRILPYRIIPSASSIILDTTILGGEAGGGITSSGLPLSSDNRTANIRIAIPSRGSVVNSFYVQTDGIAQLNDVDSAGRNSVIRDFRSGNLADGAAGRLREAEPPQIVGDLSMGITAVDAANGIVTVNKRLRFVPIRGRYPFVDGPLDATDLPLGPLAVPTQRPLLSGDFLTQDVTVELSDGSFETVSLRAEVLENLAVVSEAGNPQIGTAPGAPPGDSGQGELLPVVNLKLATVAPGRDSEGNLVSFRANTLPEGQDCAVRAVYVEEVPFQSGGNMLTDRDWRNQFLRIEPASGPPGVDVSPNASISIEFTKPIDLDQVDPSANLLVTNTPVAIESFAEQMTDPKRATTRVVPTRLTDLAGDGTVLRLQPPIGFAHLAGVAEAYSVHVRLGAEGVVDLAGNNLEISDDIGNPQDSWSVDFSLASGADSNFVAWHSYLFEAEDEDGTLPGSVDLFGQFRIENGRLIGASSVRFSRSANSQNLSGISRIVRGECWDDGTQGTATGGSLIFPVPNPPVGVTPVDPATGAPHPGLLYWQPRMSDTINPPNVPQVFEYYQSVSQPVGRVIEPLKPQGSRMQMRYIEDDFSLSYRQPSEFGIDVEQLYWSPFNDETVLYDVFDRFTMSLAHARTRPDERWTLFVVMQPMPPNLAFCVLDCASMNSALSPVFADNVLPGTSLTPVFEDKVYTINPNQASRDMDNVTYVPFPRFDRSYTWRDSRLVTIDANGDVIGLGGAQNPNANPPNNDTTASIDSPWITSVPDPAFELAGGSTWVEDAGDFVGFNQRDHDPIALPLLVDMKVFADNPANGLAQATNGFQVALLGPPSAGFPPFPGGYYDRVGSGCGFAVPPWPRLRVHASGGFDLITGAPILIDPANTLNAATSVVKDAGLGAPMTALFNAPPGDGMLHWSRADFVRKVSIATIGFFDTLQPQRALIVNQAGAVLTESGFPDWQAVNPSLRITDLVVQLDPPQVGQPAGTGVVVELRGAETFGNSGVLYNPTFAGGGQVPNDRLPNPVAVPPDPGRGNLLNANYSMEAYRYSTANVAGMARVAATGLTRYVTEDQINLIRDPATNLLPRFLNPRLIMTNNVDVNPALSPTLRSMSVIYRLVPGQ